MIANTLLMRLTRIAFLPAIFVCFALLSNAQPKILTLYPSTAKTGQTVLITGQNFNNVTGVFFGGQAAASFSVLSPTAIAAVVGSGNSGNVTVVANGVHATRAGFSFSFPPGNALRFGTYSQNDNANSPYVEIPDAPSLKPNVVTIEVWVKANPYAQNSVLVGKPNTRGPAGSYLEDYFLSQQVNYSSPASIRFSATMSRNGNQKVATTPYFSPGTASRWYFLTAIFAQDSVSIYVDGRLYQSVATGFTLDHSNYPITVGGYTDHRLSYSAVTMDELRIFGTNRKSDVAGDMNINAFNPNTPGLAAYYTFDEGAPDGSNTAFTILTDQTANNNNGRLNRFVLTPGSISNYMQSFPAVASYSPCTAKVDDIVTVNGINFNVPGEGAGIFLSTNNGGATTVTSSTTLTTRVNRASPEGPVRINSSNFSGNSPKYGFYSGQQPGNNLNFDGRNDHVIIPDAPSLDAAQLTIEAWIKPLGLNGIIIAKPNTRGPGGAYLEDYFIAMQNNRFAVTMSRDGNQKVATAQTNYDIGKWYFITAVFSRSSLKLYVNGVLQQSVNTGFELDHAAYPLVLGAAPNIQTFAACSMDELRIYNVVKTDAQVITGMNTAVADANGTDLAAYYNFDQGKPGADNLNITTLYDHSINNNHGTLYDFGLTSVTSNFVDRSAYIATFTPATASAGETVTIRGDGFTNVTAVKFGGVPAASFTVVSQNLITAVLQGGSSGDVNVVADGKTIVRRGFVYGIAPGNALHFDGANDYVTIPDAPVLKPATVTVEAWVSPAASNGYIVSKANSRGPNGAYFESYFIKINGNRFEAVMSNNGNQKVAVQTDAFTFNKWYFVMGVFSSTSVSLYVNGVLQQTTPTGFNIDHSNNPIILGAHPNLSTFTSCTIDELRIFSSNRSASALADMTASFNAATNGLVAYYNFDEGNAGGSNSIGSLADHSENNLPATLSGFALTGNSSNFIESYPVITSFSPTSAKQGQSVAIQGTNFTGTSYVRFQDIDAASFTVNSRNLVTAVPGVAGESGNITVGRPTGTATISGFKFLRPPVITSISPNSGISGTLITITGENFKNVSSITIGGVPPAASAVAVDGKTILATVGGGATGNVTVVTSDGTANFDKFTFEKYCTAGAAAQSARLLTAVIGSKTFAVSNTARGFVDLTTTPAAPLDTNTVSLITRSAVSSGDRIIVWCDFNQDGDFDDDGERVYASGENLKTSVPFNIVVPLNAVPGKTRMRIRLTRSTGANITPCGISADGQVLDIAVIIPQVPPPVVTSFSPVQAITGQKVTILGSGFLRAAAVSFGGVPARSFKIFSNTEITAVVGNGASGSVAVTVASTGSKAGFTYLPPPNIETFSPESATPGSRITIRGKFFTGASLVTIGGVVAQVADLSETIIIAIVPDSAAAGQITVTTPYGTGFKDGFIITPPVITAVTPLSAQGGTNVLIYGIYLNGTTSVKFGGKPAQIVPNTISGGGLRAIIGEVASGPVTVTTKGGTASFAGFTFLAPVIKSVSPAVATTGAKVTITYNNCSTVSSVSFGGVPAESFRILRGDTSLEAVIAGGATGEVEITSPGGIAKHSGFKFVTQPAITSFSPERAIAGTPVIIKGTNLSNISNVSFGNTNARSFKLSGDTMITAVTDFGNSGNVVVTAAGLPLTLGGFTYLGYCSIYTIGVTRTISNVTIDTFSNSSTGTTLYENFLTLQPQLNVGVNNMSVTLNNATATGQVAVYVDLKRSGSFTDAGDTLYLSPKGSGPFNFTVTVPPAAQPGLTRMRVVFDNSVYGYGPCTLRNEGQVEDYTVKIPVIPPPVITSFSPETAGRNETVTIHGTGFTGASAVMFGGVPAQSFTVQSSTKITAVLALGASGDVSVTANGTATLAGFNYIPLPKPAITSVLPLKAGTGTAIIIKGTALDLARSVSFGGVAARSFTVNSPEQITAIVGDGGPGDVSVTTVPGTATYPGFTLLNYCLANSNLGTNVITNVTVGSINNKNASAQTYQNYSDQSTPLNLDSTQVSISLANASAYENVAVYIDYNQDGDFDDAGERVYLYSDVGPVNGGRLTNVNFYIKIPVTAAPGATRMRIRLKGYTASELMQPCGTTNRGMVQDYTVIVPVIHPPVVTSFTPGSGGDGDTITISGKNLLYVNQFKFGSTPALWFMPISDTVIKAVVFKGSSGQVYVQSPKGGNLSKQEFTYIPPPTPVITSFSPETALDGETVTIEGSNFTEITSVTFGDVAAASFTVVSPTQINAVVSTGGATGFIKVTNHGGTGRSTVPFTFKQRPLVTSFSPDKGGDGTYITIFGKGFKGATSVTIGNVPVSAMYVLSDNLIGVFPGAGATGFITVTTPVGIAESATEFTYLLPPVITGFSPETTTENEEVIITGENFVDITTVQFGRVSAKSFVVVSPNEITAIVGNGESGPVIVANEAGAAFMDGFVYIPQPDVMQKKSDSLAKAVSVTGASAGKIAVPLAITAAPNPSKTNFTLFVTGDDKLPVEIRVIDMLGKVLYHERGAANRKYVFGDSFAQGMYIAQVLQGNKVKTIKLIKGQ